MDLRGLRDRLRLLGELDANLTEIERVAGVRVHVRDDAVVVSGEPSDVRVARAALERLVGAAKSGAHINPADIDLAVESERRGTTAGAVAFDDAWTLATNKRGRPIRPRSDGQRTFVDVIARHALTLCTGPAGTGKTFLAVVMAVGALRSDRVERIILSRPAVEAGEKLGFLPGPLEEKVDPYLRPLFDALGDLMDPPAIERAIQRREIEIAPLAYMRGRTLSDAFVVLDEAQNTSIEQMKMFLTRIGANSRMVACGDVTQIDLPEGVESGLVHAARTFAGVDEIGVVALGSDDVVRHPLIRRIIEAYANARR